MSEKKGATWQSFIRKEITTYRIGTLAVGLGYILNHATSGNILVPLLIQELLFKWQYITFFRAYLDTILKALCITNIIVKISCNQIDSIKMFRKHRNNTDNNFRKILTNCTGILVVFEVIGGWCWDPNREVGIETVSISRINTES